MQLHHHVFDAMASRCEIVLADMNAPHAQALAAVAVAEIKRIEAKFSRYRPDSILSRINAAAGLDWVFCDKETTALLDYVDTLFDKSNGLFDITSGILRRAWNFAEPHIPEQETLAPLLDKIGWKKVERTVGRMRLVEPDMEIDFGGFGKEYAADCAADLLIERGARHGYVNLAGDMRILGPKPDGQPWTIGIQDPRSRDGIIASIPIERGALCTSGDYERFFELDGRRYCHILDPRSGMPVNDWRSVSVLAPRALVAGSCSTIAMLKQHDALTFLESTGMTYLAVDHRGQLHHNQSM